MKKYTKLIGIIAFIAVIGFSMATLSCEDEEKDELDGTTWKGNRIVSGAIMNIVITFNSPNFTMTATIGVESQTYLGTYSISGSTVSLTSDGETVIGTLSGNTLTIYEVTLTKQ